MSEAKIIYDVMSLPEDISFDDVIRIKDKTGIVLWASAHGGSEPKVNDGDEVVIDIENLTKEQKKQIDKILKK